VGNGSKPGADPAERKLELTRRRFLYLAGAGVVGAACAPTAAPSPASPNPTTPGAAATVPAYASEPVTLTFFHYAGSNQEIVPKEVIDRYMKDNPHVKVETAQGSNAATFPGIVAAYKTTGKPTANAGYFNPDASTKGDLENIWMNLDLDRIPNAKNIAPGFRRPNNLGIGWGMSPLGIGYRKDRISPAPSSWLDLLDPKYKGRVGLPDAPLAFTFGGMIVVNRILGGTEKDMSRGFKAFSDAAKAGQFHSVFPGNQALKDLMVKGEVNLVGYSYGNLAPWRKEGVPIDYVVPKEGQVAFPLYFQILKGSTPAQVYHSEQIINRLLAPETLARYAELVLIAPANPQVPLPADLAQDPAFAKANIEKAIQIDWTTVAESTTDWLAQWNRDVKANLR